jgi:hypothetical protein
MEKSEMNKYGFGCMVLAIIAASFCFGIAADTALNQPNKEWFGINIALGVANALNAICLTIRGLKE